MNSASTMSVFAMMLGLGGVLCCLSQAAETVLDIGLRRELFVDDWLIESMDGTRLRLHHPKRAEVVFHFDAAYEVNGAAYVTVIQEDDRYRMYYRANGVEGHPESICYAESADGIHWARPELMLYPTRDNQPTNRILQGEGTHNLTPFRDTYPALPGEVRYLALGNADREEDGRRDCVLVAFKSEDGLQWEATHAIGRRDHPPKEGEVHGLFDSQNVAFWDAERSEYRLYWRITEHGARAIATATSTDFRTWVNSTPLAYTEGTPHEHLYTSGIVPYGRAPHLLVGIPQRFIPKQWMSYAVDEERNKIPLSDVVFMTSRDGVHWHRWREAFIRPGTDPERWNTLCHANNMPALGIVTTPASDDNLPDELSFYVTESTHADPKAAEVAYSPGPRHTRLRRYTLRNDGFVSVYADGQGGEFTTKLLRITGDELQINYSTSAAGGIRIEILDLAGNAFPGYSWKEFPELRGDAVDHTVKWTRGSSLKNLFGQAVRLRFLMKDADIFSMRFIP